MIKSRRMRWAGHVASTGQMVNAYIKYKIDRAGTNRAKIRDVNIKSGGANFLHL
jgi:hypothetical protein